MDKTVLGKLTLGIVSVGLMVGLGYVAARVYGPGGNATNPSALVENAKDILMSNSTGGLAGGKNTSAIQEDTPTGLPKPLSRETDILGVKLSMTKDQAIAVMKSKSNATIEEIRESVGTKDYSLTVVTGYKCNIPQGDDKKTEDNASNRLGQQAKSIGSQRKDQGSNHDTVKIYTDSQDGNKIIAITRSIGYNPRSAPLRPTVEDTFRAKYGPATLDFGTDSYYSQKNGAIWSTLPVKEVVYPRVFKGSYSKFVLNSIKFVEPDIDLSLPVLLTHESVYPNKMGGLGLELFVSLLFTVDDDHVAGIHATLLDYDALSHSVQFLLNKVRVESSSIEKAKRDVETQRKPRL